MTDSDRSTSTGCGCDPGDRDRRTFLRDVIGAGAGLFLAAGFPPGTVGLGIRQVRGDPDGARLAYAVPPRDGVTIDRDNEIMIARVRGFAYAFDLSCPHQRAMLKWLADDGRFQCPKHKSKYLADGTYVSGRATRNVDRHPVRLEGDRLVVDLDLVIESDKDPAGWAAARVAVD